MVLFSADHIAINDEHCLLDVSVDRTVREKDVDVLRQSEGIYRALVENSLQGLSIIQDDCFMFCNNAFAAMTGYSIEELLSFPNAVALLHPDDQPIANKRKHDRVAGMPVPAQGEHRIIKKDGTVCWHEIHASLIEYNGKPAFQLISMDITERRLAEAELRESREYLARIINQISDPIFVKDSKHKYVLVNDALCAFEGKTREQLVGQSSFDELPEDLAAALFEREAEVFRTGKEGFSEDTFADWKGQIRTMLAKKALLVDQKGNQQIVGVLRDITEYKNLEAQFLQSQKMEAIGILAGGVAHDFNNLLNVINGYTEIMLEELAQDNPMRQDLEQVINAGQRASALTTQLLAFGRKQMLQPEILDLNDVVTSMTSMLGRLIPENINLVTIPQPSLGLINVDLGQLQQIIMNLAVNARDALLQGGELTIETADVEFDKEYASEHPAVQSGSYVMLAISDNGLGMDQATQAHLFEPFFTTKEKGKGTGLGLSTVYGIVKQSNGFIWVYSELGKGTTFKIYFPRAEGRISPRPHEKELESEIRGSETVLVVEDEASVRMLACRILYERGYTVLEALNGAEALDIARRYIGDIHLILTDVVMPGMSGPELVSRLKEGRPDIKALYVSGYTDNVIVHNGALDSEVDFLQKPFTVKGLAHKIREVLNS
jgi:PAS domain S-box-containing protein